jgi:hypothetical protein
MKSIENDNLSFFDEAISEKASASHTLDVLRLRFDGAETATWKDLFSGFDHLYAITYSSGIGFMYQLLDLFESAQIIFGCENVMSYTLQEVMAFQNKVIDRMREKSSDKRERLISRIEDQSVRFYVARTLLSHEKIYLLSSQDGRKRVIMGSANMSFNAFAGIQRENICYLDDEKAYDWYYEVFEELKSSCTDEITRQAFESSDLEEHIDELPVVGTVKMKKALVIEPVKENQEEVQFVLDVRKLADKLAPVIPKAEKKTGKVVISPEHIIKLRRHIMDENTQQRELRSEYPHLVMDVLGHRATLNDEILDLAPDPKGIKNDIELFLKYMQGYERFHGDVSGLQQRYFEFANWFFCSPFMAVMRDMAARFDQNRLPYPVFGLVYGQSKAGKTSFLETLLKMMIGQKPKVSAPDFTRSNIEAFKRNVEGAPIIVDDLTNTRFNQHAIETIKNDDFGVSDHLIHYPAVVISANEDVKAVSPEVIRRTVICRVSAGLTNTEVMRSNVVRSVQQKIGTAFYRAYVNEMLDRLPDLIEQLRQDDTEAPDILKLSSEIIVSLISQYVDDCPVYIRPLSLENYFSEQVTGKYAIKTIREAWKTSYSSFDISSRTNELRYNAGAPYEADRLLKELPENLEAHKSREWVIMNLEEARTFFGVSFKKRWLIR